MDNTEEMSGPYAKALAAGGLDLLAKTLAKEVNAWLSERDMSGEDKGGVSYHTWMDYFDRPMRTAVALVICTETFSVGEELDGVGEWEDFLWDIGFSYEMRDPTVMVLYPEEDGLGKLVREAFAFEWHSRLVAPDYAEIYSSIYSYFAQNPERMSALCPRAWEKFLASVFTERGYETILGPGRADGGVDLRLTRDTVYGDQVTVVQAKRKKRPIELELVAALSGVMVDQSVERGIMVTTSRYLPSAQKFASRQAREIILATSRDVALWCQAIAAKKGPSGRIGTVIRGSEIHPARVVCAELGYDITYHEFAYIVAESPTAVRLAGIPSKDLPEMRRDGGRQGCSVPDLTQGIARGTVTITARRACNSFGEGEHFWGDNGQMYTPWSGRPMAYRRFD
jgi:restriction system protein